MRSVILGISLILSLGVSAQEGLMSMDYFDKAQAEVLLVDSLTNIHPQIKPLTYWTIKDNKSADDTSESYVSLAHIQTSKSYLRVTPILSLSGGVETGANNQQVYSGEGGVSLGAGINNKFYVGVQGVLGYLRPKSYQKSVMDSLNVFPGYSYAAKLDKNGYGLNYLSAVVCWRPTKYFQIFGGRGKHFIGEGYRSLFLSDFAQNYQYVRPELNIWRLKYMVLYSQMSHAENPSSYFPKAFKYSTSHYLSLNVTKWLNIGLFESVVWESEDSVVNRHYDPQYLNPIIFYRPVEYGIGSSDNSLLGVSITLRPVKNWALYSQIAFDELVVSEWNAPIRARLSDDPTIQTGWWANKQGYQFGVKAIEPFGWKGGTALAELNVVRPFTYGHSNPKQSYTHLNQSLAHPLGANFIEWVQVATWTEGSWKVGLFNTYARKGYSNSLGFLGEDPLVSNAERDQNNREYGNFILQGTRVDVLNTRVTVGYDLIPNWNMRLEANLQYRFERTKTQSQDMIFFGLGLRTALWSVEDNY